MTALEFRSVNLHRSVAWLRGLEAREIDWVLASAKSRRFPGKSVMTSQGDVADDLLLLWDGRARYFFQTANGKKVILMWITPGDIFGGAALVSRPSHYLFSTEAVRDSIALVWELEDSRSGATLSATPGKRTAHCFGLVLLVYRCARSLNFPECTGKAGAYSFWIGTASAKRSPVGSRST